jgi:hypothetical protein
MEENRIMPFTNDSGQKIFREFPQSTKFGIVFSKGQNDTWFIDFPDRKTITITTIELINLIYFLKETNGNLDKSRQWVGIK